MSALMQLIITLNFTEVHITNEQMKFVEYKFLKLLKK